MMFSVSSQYAESSVDATGEGPNLSPRITQAQVVSWPLPKIQKDGVRIFSTPFNFHDGFGDGPAGPGGPLDEGGRPTLQSNGTFLRVNGLDGQTIELTTKGVFFGTIVVDDDGDIDTSIVEGIDAERHRQHVITLLP